MDNLKVNYSILVRLSTRLLTYMNKQSEKANCCKHWKAHILLNELEKLSVTVTVYTKSLR